MGRICTVCTHPEREAIDRELIAATPLRAIVSRYVPLSRGTMQRHALGHVLPQLAKAKAAEEAARADDLIARLATLTEGARRIQARAEAEGDLPTALRAIRELCRQLELLAELRHELNRQPLTIVSAPEWLALRAQIIQVLGPYPDARAALAEVIMRHNGDHDRPRSL